jgi:DNA repair photolyase
MKIIYEPTGKAREYAPLAVNLYSGCLHGCKYCFGPQALRKHKNAFSVDVHPKKHALERLQADASKLNGDDREILLSFVTDPYQPLEIQLEITRGAIRTLIENDLRFTILTKGGTRAVRDFDLLEGYDKGRFGSTIIFIDQDDADAWEPNAPSIQDRIRAIEIARASGIRTWVSLEPVIDPEQALQLIREIHPIVDHWKVGKINYHPEVERKVDWIRFREEVTALLDSLEADYYLKESLTEL